METMESSFYHEVIQKKKKGLVNCLKSNMTLDFTTEKTKQRKLAGMLNSPDINMLKLASPELERLIIQQGGVATTPTPNTQILFPKSVTEEQEAYARGFVDALAELHQKKVGDESSDENSDSDDHDDASNCPTYTTLTTVSEAPDSVHGCSMNMQSSSGKSVYTYTTVAQLPTSIHSHNSRFTDSTQKSNPDIMLSNQSTRANSPMQYATSPRHIQLMHVKEEPQRVPSLSPQLTPIDMGQQEGIKLDRKRARNRVAARKCRTRKLERISRLEDRVDDLKGQNSKLVQTASDLREQVFALKQQILEHVNSGCKVMLSANLV